MEQERKRQELIDQGCEVDEEGNPIIEKKSMFNGHFGYIVLLGLVFVGVYATLSNTQLGNLFKNFL